MFIEEVTSDDITETEPDIWITIFDDLSYEG